MPGVGCTTRRGGSTPRGVDGRPPSAAQAADDRHADRVEGPAVGGADGAVSGPTVAQRKVEPSPERSTARDVSVGLALGGSGHTTWSRWGEANSIIRFGNKITIKHN